MFILKKMFFLQNGILKPKYLSNEFIDDSLSDVYTQKLLQNVNLPPSMTVQIVDICNVCDKCYFIHLYDGKGILVSLIDFKILANLEKNLHNESIHVQIIQSFKLQIGSIIKINGFDVQELADLIIHYDLQSYYELDNMEESDRKKKIFYFKDFQILGFQPKTIYKDSECDEKSSSIDKVSKRLKTDDDSDDDDIEIIDYIPNRVKVDDDTKYFIPLDRLGMVNKRFVEVMGIILEIDEFSKQQETQTTDIQLRRFKLIDMTRTIVSVALWGKEAENFNYPVGTIIMLNNCKLTNFRGVSLSVHRSTFLTEVHKNTTHRLGRKLFKWWIEFKTELNDEKNKKRKILSEKA